MISDPNNPQKLSANEGIKERSNFLRGQILESLSDESTGAISADDAQLTKFHGTYMQDDRDKRAALIKEKKEKAYSFMIPPNRRLPMKKSCNNIAWEKERLEADLENNLLYLKGAVPGSKNSYVEIQEAIKNKNKSSIKERVEKYKASLAEMQSTKKDKKKKDKKTETPATEKSEGEGTDKK